MAISRYPRLGHPIAPFLLREILDVPLPSFLIVRGKFPKETKLRNFDENIWTYRSPQTCKTLANLVVNQVKRAIISLPVKISTRPLPRFLKGRLDDLQL